MLPDDPALEHGRCRVTLTVIDKPSDLVTQGLHNFSHSSLSSPTFSMYVINDTDPDSEILWEVSPAVAQYHHRTGLARLSAAITIALDGTFLVLFLDQKKTFGRGLIMIPCWCLNGRSP